LRIRDTHYADKKQEIPVSVRKRIEKYRSSGGAADLVKVEVLVPPSSRADVLQLAARLRSEHRDARRLRQLCDRALSLYGARVLDNVDLDRVPDLRRAPELSQER
jgi:Cdc6-like AAA superfamily ATPase